jgi:hypothetical protein
VPGFLHGVSYGFAPPQVIDTMGIGAPGHALAVLDAPSRWLSVSQADAKAANGQPIDVRVWADSDTVLRRSS